MTAQEPDGTGPGEARRAVDELEAAITAETAQSDEDDEGDLHGDWVPRVPGGSEPPD